MSVFRGLFIRRDGTRGTQPAEARKALAGLLVPSSALGARQGILAAPGNPLQVTGTAGWQYSVNAGHLASSRSDADGAVLYGNDGTALTPAVAAAPGSGSRWDLIYLRHEDVEQGGGETSAATLGVVSGVASGTPVRPTLPAGAVLVAEALVAAFATSTSHANVTITNVLPQTVARGGILPVTLAQRDALTTYPGMPPVIRLDTGQLEFYRAGEWRTVPSNDDTGWQPLAAISAAGWNTPAAASTAARYRRIGNRTFMDGILRNNAGLTTPGAYALATLPTGYRPSSEQRLIVAGWVSGGTTAPYPDELIVGTTGVVTLTVQANRTGTYLSGVSWLTD